MAKRKKGGRRRRKISIFSTAGILVGLKNLWDAYQQGGGTQAMVALTGYNSISNDFDYKRATAGIPMILGPLASMVASKAGINRHVNIPMFKL